MITLNFTEILSLTIPYSKITVIWSFGDGVEHKGRYGLKKMPITCIESCTLYASATNENFVIQVLGL